MTNFIIQYTVLDTYGNTLKTGVIRALRKANSFDAQVKFEEYLKKKYSNFDRLIVHACREENIFDQMLGADNPFNDLFKGFNQNK